MGEDRKELLYKYRKHLDTLQRYILLISTYKSAASHLKFVTKQYKEFKIRYPASFWIVCFVSACSFATVGGLLCLLYIGLVAGLLGFFIFAVLGFLLGEASCKKKKPWKQIAERAERYKDEYVKTAAKNLEKTHKAIKAAAQEPEFFEIQKLPSYLQNLDAMTFFVSVLETQKYRTEKEALDFYCNQRPKQTDLNHPQSLILQLQEVLEKSAP